MPSPPPKLVEKVRVTAVVPAIAVGDTGDAAAAVPGLLDTDSIVVNPVTASALLISVPRFIPANSFTVKMFNPGPNPFPGGNFDFDVAVIR